jgi:glycerol-3-phosphate cytidylyltransferase
MLQEIKKLQEQGKKVIATNGCFDILHVGHLRYLEASKALGDILVVGLNSDKSVKRLKGESRPINNQEDRAEMLLALKPVDFVVIFDEDTAEEFLKSIRPSIYTKGGDYSLSDLEKWPEYHVAQQIACKIELISFIDGKSSTNIINQINKS